jgi:glucose-6-phosphate dehydrogenase assembly protein OpcA
LSSNPQFPLGVIMSSVDVAAIERELTSLWKQASEDEGDSGVIRASMLNLLIYAPGTAASSEVDEMIPEITAAHPCRAILIIADREAAESSLAAQVTSRCTLPTAATKQVCCEEVTITVTGSQVNEVPSVVVPLMLSDLPVYLWWNAVPRLADRVFSRLVDLSDRVIIDSADFTDPHGDLISLSALVHDKPRWTAFSDLNWARLTAWRALLAGFYDVPAYRPLLAQLDKVVIEYAAPSHDKADISPRALLLGGWLVSRLGWELDADASTLADGRATFHLSDGGRAITLEFVTTENAEIEPGHLARVELGSAADSTASFNVRRSDDRSRIETEVTFGTERSIQRVLGYESWGETALIGRELEIQGHDRVYEQAVMAAGGLVVSLV